MFSLTPTLKEIKIMQRPEIFYKEQLAIHNLNVKRAKKSLIQFSLIRFIVFIAAGFGIYFTLGQSQVAIGIGITGLVVFLLLLKKYGKVKYQEQLSKALVSINEEEIKIASGDFYDRESGSKYQDPKHFYSLDIDLFGKGSFFQYINRTKINEGSQALANAFTANSIENIVDRQEAIKELSSVSEWRQTFSGIASFNKKQKLQ